MARKRSPGIAISTLQESLQTQSVRDAVGFDKRALGRSRRLMGVLAGYDKTEAAQALELSARKYATLRAAVAEGKVSSSTLNDMLEDAVAKLDVTPQLRRETYTLEQPVRGKRTRKTDVWEVGLGWIRKEAPYARDIKPGGFASRRSALNWLGNVGGAAEYFFVVRKQFKDRTRFHIYDIRTPSEYKNRGNLTRQPKAVRKVEATS